MDRPWPTIDSVVIMLPIDACQRWCLARLYQEVTGSVIIFRHKVEHLRELVAAYPADHYVLVEDKPEILQTVKQSLGDQVTTVFVRQGKYAAALVSGSPEPDVVLDSIAGFIHLDIPAMAQGVAHVAG